MSTNRRTAGRQGETQRTLGVCTNCCGQHEALRIDADIYEVTSGGMDAETHPFLENPLVMIAPHDHPLARARHVPLNKLAGERLILRE